MISLLLTGLCWPTKQEIEERKEYEVVAFPYTIREVMDAAAVKRREEQLRREQRDMEVAAKVAKLEQWKKELNDKIAKKAAEVEAAKVRHLLQLSRDHGHNCINSKHLNLCI